MTNNYHNRNLIESVLDLAKANLGKGIMKNSADVCYKRACEIMWPAWDGKKADIDAVIYNALRSLSYSVGVFHADYKLAQDVLARAN